MLGPSDRPGRISIPCADAAVAPMSMMESARAMCFKGSPPQDCLVARCQHLKFNFVPLIRNNMTRTISGKIFGISFGRHLLGSTLRNTGAREDRQPGGLATQHASCDTNTMSGWLMQAIYPGTSPETPKTVEMWAVWVSDQAKAAVALAEAAGSAIFQAPRYVTCRTTT